MTTRITFSLLTSFLLLGAWLPLDQAQARSGGIEGASYSPSAGRYCVACHNTPNTTPLPTVTLYQVDLSTSPPTRLVDAAGNPAPTTVAPGQTVNLLLLIQGGAALRAPYGTLDPLTNAYAAGSLNATVEDSMGMKYGSLAASLNPENLRPDGAPWVYLVAPGEITHSASCGTGCPIGNGTVISSLAPGTPIGPYIYTAGSGSRPINANGEVEFYFSWTAPAAAELPSLPFDLNVYAAGQSDITDGGTSNDSSNVTTHAVTVASTGAPIALPGGPYSGNIGDVIQFDGSASYDTDGTISSYTWSFGDGSSGSGMAPTHAYAAAGTYTVTLTVVDNDGNAGSGTTTATILGNEAPIADPGGPYTGVVGVPLSLDGAGSSDANGDVLSYHWHFGDGVVGAGATVSHTYNAVGTYNVSLVVYDGALESAAANTTATVAAGQPLEPPVAVMNKDADGRVHVVVNVPRVFDGSASSDADGVIESYLWDFDATGTPGTYTAAGKVVEFTYTPENLGVTVGLTVTDNDGLSDEEQVRVVRDLAPPEADAGPDVTGARRKAVLFDGSGSTDVDGTIASYLWDFGDGSSAAGATVEHSYDSEGTYTVTLVVVDNAGLSDSDTAIAAISRK